MKQQQRLILGPPGCGKTTYLLNQVQEEMANGIDPSRIAYVSFTRKAANEAAERAQEKFNSERSDFPYFRTLHSLAYQQLGLSRQQVMGRTHYAEIGRALGLEFGQYLNFEEGLPISTRSGDQCLFTTGYSRATLQPLEQVYNESANIDISWWELKQFADTLDEYKRERLMLDFADMLDQFISNCLPLDIDVAFIDEAQDLSLQQWRMAWHAVQRAKRVYIAGDDDQAIYRWSGADVNTFLTLPGERVVLEQSYRCPQAVHEVCSRISRRIGHRYNKIWQPRNDRGEVITLHQLEDIEWRQGTYLMLARNRYLLQRMESLVRSMAIPYTIGNRSSVDPAAIAAIKTWEKLRKGEPQFAADIRGAYSFLRSGDGYRRGNKQLPGVADDLLLTIDDLKDKHGLLRDDIWHEALIGIPTEEREFYLAARRRGESLSRAPRVHISTIHGVKGGEADHVVLISDMAPRTYHEYMAAPDDEHRVAYVGASRARQTLSIISPATDRGYHYW